MNIEIVLTGNNDQEYIHMVMDADAYLEYEDPDVYGSDKLY